MYKRQVGVGVKTAAVAFYGGVGVQHQRQQLIQAVVHIGLGNFAGPYGGQPVSYTHLGKASTRGLTG